MNQFISRITAAALSAVLIAAVPFSVGAAELDGTEDNGAVVEQRDDAYEEVAAQLPDEEPTVGVTEAATVPLTEPLTEAETEPATEPTTQPATEQTEQNYTGPRITGFENTATGTKVTFTGYPGASKIRLFYWNGTTWKGLGNSTSGAYTHNKLKNGTTYRYTVRALDKNGKYMSDYWKAGYENTFLAPFAPSKVAPAEDGMSVQWKEVPTADAYNVYRKSGKTFTKIGTSTELEYIDQNVAANTSYTYAVRAVSGGREVTVLGGSKTAKFIKAPVITKLENTATGTAITWNKPAGATRFRVYSYENDTWKRLAELTGTTYTHNNLTSGRTYLYTVRCVNASGSFVSGFVHAGWENTFLAPPVISSLVGDKNGVTLEWNALPNTERYRIYRRTGTSTKWDTLGESTTTSYVDSTAATGKTYTYTVRSLTPDGKKRTSYFLPGNSISYNYVAAPVITNHEYTADGVKLSWQKVKGASKYRVYLQDGSKQTTLGDTTGNTFIHKNPADDTAYTYSVASLDSKGNVVSGSDSESKTVYSLKKPEIGSVKRSGDANLITWDAAEHAAGYRLYRKTPDKGWARLFDGIAQTSYLDTTAKEGQAYVYTLRCLDEDGCLISHYIDYSRYYIDGAIADGEYTIDGNRLIFEDGTLQSGYQILGGKRYYYKNGVIQKNDVIGSASEGWYYADENGVCCESEEMRLAAEFLMTCGTGNTTQERMKTGFLYLAKKFPYNRSYDHPKTASDLAPLAIDMFTNKKGNCFRYAACFTCMAKAAGYRARMCVGKTGNGSPHGWTEVLVDGKWLICDPDAQLPGYGKPDYYPYMMTKHYWNVSATFKSELVIEDGKAIWK